MILSSLFNRRMIIVCLVIASISAAIVFMVTNVVQAAPLAQPAIPPDLFAGSVAPAEPIALGAFDLVITLEEANGNLTGAVDTELTQVFAGAGAPALSGQISGTDGEGNPTFTLASNRFSSTISGRDVVRTLTLSGSILKDGTTLQGQYTESIRGFTPEPIDVSGEFLVSAGAVVRA